LQLVLAGVLAAVVLLFAGLAGVAGAYAYLARDLPSIDDLQARASSFQTTTIYDRNGRLLYELNDPSAGRRTRVPLARIAPALRQATIDTEDKYFYSNPGFDPIGIARAIKQGLEEGEAVSGASTITQQLVRALVLTPEEAAERSARRKVREIILASEISRRYSKDEILELYLNEIYYGNLAYGVEAAAQTYYGVSAGELNLAQASLLAGLPQAPSVYDPFVNYDLALGRQEQVLALMVEQGHATPAQAEEAMAWAQANPPVPPPVTFDAPHFVNTVRQALEPGRETPGYDLRRGLKVTTTLDRDLQALAEQAVREQIAELAGNPNVRNVTNGALVAIDPRSGEVLAMVGSVDYNDETIDGQVNVALRCRQPGSSIKPFTYLAALRGFDSNGQRVYWTPGTVIWDVPTEFPDQPGQPYRPENYDGRFHGPQPMRFALANSYNIPAVRTLQFVGVPALLDLMDSLGVHSLKAPQDFCPDYPYETAPPYGLALTLGGGETTLLEMTAAYGALANGGQPLPPKVLLRVTDLAGNEVAPAPLPAADTPAGAPVTPAQAFLLSSILSDNAARTPAFGENSPLKLSRPAAVKTGTTNDYRDNWAIGYTPELVAGVWVGNNDNTPMEGVVSGITGAAPIWHNFMEAALASRPATAFEPPPGVLQVELCAESGALPSERCTNRRVEFVLAESPPPPVESDLWRKVRIDRFSGLRANEFCPDQVIERWFGVLPEEAAVRDWVHQSPAGLEWARARSLIPLADWLALSPEAQEDAHARGLTPLMDPPRDACGGETGRPDAYITLPIEGQQVAGTVEILGFARAPNFAYYTLEYGFSLAPEAWGVVGEPRNTTPVDGGRLASWDTSALESGAYSLRVIVVSTSGGRAEGPPVHVVVVAPTATPTETPSPTETATPPAPIATPTVPLPVFTALPTFTPPLPPPFASETPGPFPTAPSSDPTQPP
jgi:penicillin-binding protein 1C